MKFRVEEKNPLNHVFANRSFLSKFELLNTINKNL